MKNIVVLSNDARTVSQIVSRKSELKDPATFEVFRTLEDFDRFVTPPEIPAKDSKAPAKPPAQESVEQKQSMYMQALFKEKGIHLIIVDHELLGKLQPVAYIQKLNERLAASEIHKPDIQIRFMLLSFEMNSTLIETLSSQLIDDVIIKPLDNQLFLQKLSMVISDKRSSSGEFLYKQEVDANIYVAKGGIIDGLSDFGMTVQSKKSVRDGLIVRIYAKVFGDKKESSLFVRAYKSIPHPTVPGEFKVHYTYYGITAAQLQKVRRTLHGKPRRASTTKSVTPAELQNIKKTKRNIAIVAFNAQMRSDIENALGSNFVNLAIHGFPSIVSFAKKMGVLEPKPEAAAAAPVAAPAIPDPSGMIVAFASDVFIFNINFSDEVILVVNKTVSLFDQTSALLVANPKKWLQFLHPDDLDETIEFLNYVKSNDKGSIFVRMRGPFGSTHHIKIDAEEVKGAKPSQIKIQMSELKGPEGLKIWQAARPEVKQEGRIELDTILIDASGITQTVESWAIQIKSFLENVKILGPDKKVSIVALLPEKSMAKLEEFKLTFFNDVFLTPIDRKHLIDKVNFHAIGLCTADGFVSPGFDSVREQVKLAQEVKMEMASEFGVQIRSTQIIKEGVFLRLFSPLFLDENYDGILARSYSSEADEKDKTMFHCVFSFYGISDAFLKHIRKWIRETHIAKKDPKD